MFVVKQRFGKCLCKLCFADARGTEEQERTNGSVRVGNAGTGTDDCVGNALYRFVLTYHALMENCVKTEYLFALALHQLGYGYSRPACDDCGYFLFRHFIAEQGSVVLAFCGRGCGFKLFLKLRQR